MRTAIMVLLTSCTFSAYAIPAYIPAVSIVDASTHAPSVEDRLRSVDLSAFLEMDRAGFESVTERRMTFGQRLQFNRMKREAERNPAAFENQALVKLAEKGNRRTHWASIVAICCGGLAIFTGIAAIPAIVFGAIGMSKSGPRKDYKGGGLAIAGLVTGILLLGFWIFIAAAFLG